MSEVIHHQTQFDAAKWFTNYTIRRYGLFDSKIDQAWQLLRTSVYTDPVGIWNFGQYAINRRPELQHHSPLWYSPANVTSALKLMSQYLNGNPSIVGTSETFVYDMVDLSRQTLQLVFDYYREEKMFPQFKRKQIDQLKATNTEILHLFDLLENVLQCSEHFLLHRWVKSARALGNDTAEQDYNEWQARNQVTLWGPKGNVSIAMLLNNYNYTSKVH